MRPRHVLIVGLLLMTAPARAGDQAKPECRKIRIAISATPQLPVSNLIPNPGFEQPAGPGTPYHPWGSGGFWRGKGEAEVTSDECKYGSRSFRFVGLSKDAAGHCVSPPLRLYPDIPYIIDFYIRATKGAYGTVQVRYKLENPKLIPDLAVASIPKQSLTLLADRWIRFRKPPDMIVVTPNLLLFKPRQKGETRTYWSYKDLLLVFPRSSFNYQQSISARLVLTCRGEGVIWFDDILLIPAKTRLHFTVQGGSIREIRLWNQAGNMIWQKKLQQSTERYEQELLVPAGFRYRLEVITTDGKSFTRYYPGSGVMTSGQSSVRKDSDMGQQASNSADIKTANANQIHTGEEHGQHRTDRLRRGRHESPGVHAEDPGTQGQRGL